MEAESISASSSPSTVMTLALGCFEAARCDSGRERVVVALVLVGIGIGEVGHRVREGVVLTEVTRDRKRISRPGVGMGEGPSAERGVHLEPTRAHLRNICRTLHVVQLTPVESATPATDRPTEKDVASRLHQTLAFDYPLAVMGIPTFRKMSFQDRRGGFLDLEEQRIGVVVRLE